MGSSPMWVALGNSLHEMLPHWLRILNQGNV